MCMISSYRGVKPCSTNDPPSCVWARRSKKESRRSFAEMKMD